MPVRESQVIELLARAFENSGRPVPVGIGDDCAVLQLDGAGIYSVDTSVEGVHFDASFMGWFDIAYRAFQAAVSDLAAMGASPRAALCSWILPRAMSRSELGQLAAGTARVARQHECPVVGGNLSKGRELSLTTTVIGEAVGGRWAMRSTARPGHELWLAGSVGEAALGLRALRSGRAPRAVERECVERFLRPTALVAEGQQLAAVGASMMDVSDGLAEDAHKLARASCVRLVISEGWLRRCLSASLLAAARAQRVSALRRALYGGEDFALLATGQAACRPPEVSRIGWVESGCGVSLQGCRGRVLLPRGFDHLVCT